MNAGSWCKVCQTGRNHIFVCMYFVCVFLVVLFRAKHLIVSWFMTAHRYMLDLLGDVTSTVSSCQLSGDVCYPTICEHDFHALYGPIFAYKSMTLCIVHHL